jgi:hypothetical protein
VASTSGFFAPRPTGSIREFFPFSILLKRMKARKNIRHSPRVCLRSRASASHPLGLCAPPSLQMIPPVGSSGQFRVVRTLHPNRLFLRMRSLASLHPPYPLRRRPAPSIPYTHTLLTEAVVALDPATPRSSYLARPQLTHPHSHLQGRPHRRPRLRSRLRLRRGHSRAAPPDPQQ